MRMFAKTALAASVSAGLLGLAPAFAAETHGNMMAAGPMHPMHITCKVAESSDKGMMLEFHNMGREEIPAGTKVHWRLRGAAQGDMDFAKAVAPGGMDSQNYMAHDSMHMSARTPCMVEMTH